MQAKRTPLSGYDDVALGYIDQSTLGERLLNGQIVSLNGRARKVLIGQGVPVKINTNIGISDTTPLELERDKLSMLSKVRFRPDLIMDHTIKVNERDFWKEIVQSFDGPVGTLPQYTVYSPTTGIDKTALLERIAEMLEGGVAFMTLHFTSDMDIYHLAQRSRPIPITSRGGGLAIRDLLISKKNENVFRAAFSEIVSLFRKHDAAISVGTTFRPANVLSALDEAHVLETQRQIEIVHKLRNAGVKVLMEGVGHVSMNKIETYIELAKIAQCPFMPLGPMTTDSAIGFDHVTNAIGGAFMAFRDGAHVLNSVTREEHTGGVPSKDSIIEGVKAARVAAHSVNVAKFERAAEFDQLTIERRGKQVSCVVSGGLFDAEVDDPQRGCTRCSYECPIILAPANPIM